MKRLTLLLMMIAMACFIFAERRTAGQQSSVAPTPGASPPAMSSPSPIGLNSVERFEYDKLRLQRDLQKELLEWAQTRFWIFAILTFLIGFFGVRALVREMISSELKEATRAAAQAEAAADHTREVTKDVRADADKYRETVAQLSETATRVDDRFKELDGRIAAEGAHAVASSELQLSQLAKRLDELSEVVKTAASESRESKEALRLYDARIAALKSESSDQRANFLENSQYSVMVIRHPAAVGESLHLGAELLSALTKQGYRVSTGMWEKTRPAELTKISIRYKSGKHKLAVRLEETVRELLQEWKRDVPIELLERESMTSHDAMLFFSSESLRQSV
ncbi:MAG: hypothetical protein H7Z16_09885 [Pyrinomonadaceae bacterium]|nr:hypothetical protein [Pyrinomonadaceae bacterium]